MATMWGADIQQLVDCSRTFHDGADLIEQSRSTIDSSLTSTPWEGADAEAFFQQWTGTTSPQLVNIATALRDAAGDLVRHADEQNQASGGPGGGSGGGGGSWPPGGSGGPNAWFNADGWANADAGADGNITFGPNSISGEGEAYAYSGIGGDVNAGFQYGDVTGEANASGFFGGSANADGSFNIGPDGIDAEGHAEALLGAQGEFDASVEVGELGSVYANGEGVVGAHAEADGSFSVDESGAELHLSSEALLGAEGEVTAGAELDGIASAEVTADGRAGLWADANADSNFEIHDDGISFGADVGAHAGAGAEGGISTSVDIGDGLFGYNAGIDGSVGEVGGGGGFGVDLQADRVGFQVSGDIAAGLGIDGDVGFYFSPTGVADLATDTAGDVVDTFTDNVGGAVDAFADSNFNPGNWSFP